MSMMDADNIIVVSANGIEFDNGLHQPLSISEKNPTSNGSLEIEGLVGNLEAAVKLNDPAPKDSTHEFMDGQALPAESHLTNTSKEIDVEDSGNLKNLNPVKIMRTLRSGKSSVASNGTVAPESKPRQTIILKAKSKSFNESQATDNSKAVSIRNSKKTGHSDATSSSTSGAQSENLLGKTKLKALRKGPPTKVEEATESSPSPTSGDAKERKSGTFPTYGFNFKCNERAEKRREFFSKLEEKIHAKEEEQNNLQAMSKETQEAEIRRFRKSLGFKATPMPTFYQEPVPPKVELKKIPTTRAKSPKLGRKKTTDSVENSALIARPVRLSLDVKVSKTNFANAHVVAHVKNPSRKSLPKLPSENTSEKKKATTRKIPTSRESGEPVIQPDNSFKEAISDTQPCETGTTGEPIEIQSNIEGESVVQAQEQNALQEPIRV